MKEMRNGMVQSRNTTDLSLSSPVFPGGSLLSAIFDRDVMRLSDRGGASGLIGDRWSDICSAELASWPGTHVETPDGPDASIERIVRLDDIPAIARTASRKKLQNPDYLALGRFPDHPVMFSVDAKFSVETAVASQVSADALRSLTEIGSIFTDHVGVFQDGVEIVDGIFLSPDYSLTHYMLGRRRGYRSVSVARHQIHLLPVAPVSFLKPLEGARMIPVFAEVDGYDPETRSSLLVALYYFRLARAVIGCWGEQVAPLLGPKKVDVVDLDAIEEQTRLYSRDAQSGWEIVDRWDAAAESVRTQRETVNRVTAVPIVNRELREEIEAAVAEAGVEAPSMNRVRRRIGSWFRDEVIKQVGLLTPPIADFPAVIHQLELVSAELRLQLPEATTRIIHEMILESPESELVDGMDTQAPPARSGDSS
jgi:hypothetical protein